MLCEGCVAGRKRLKEIMISMGIIKEKGFGTGKNRKAEWESLSHIQDKKNIPAFFMKAGIFLYILLMYA